MKQYFNDSPIENVEQDTFGVANFAKALAKSLLSIKAPIGSTIALQGPWGSGKSSAVNLIRKEIGQSCSANLVVNEFKCWWFRGEEALALAFLQAVHDAIEPSLGEKAEAAFKSLSKRILQAGPVIGAGLTAVNPILGAFTGAASAYLDKLFSGKDSLEKLHRELSEALACQQKRFLIIIDDLDRLKPAEMLSVFQMVKSVGRLPNVMYLMVFDRALAEKAVNDICPSEGPHFLEKIVQAGFDLPMPLQSDLNHAVLSAFDEICGEMPEDQHVRFFNVFYDVVAPYVTTPRHVARLRNAISVTWPAIANEVDRADFLALETIRLYEVGLYNAIFENSTDLVGARGRNDNDNVRNRRFEKFLKNIPEGRHETVKTALQRLFPNMEEITYGNDSQEIWDAERRVCVQKHFRTYARLSLSEEVLPTATIDELVLRCDDEAYVKDLFIDASQRRRKNGESYVPVYLDALMGKAKKIPLNKVKPLMHALFFIHDRIDLEVDRAKGFHSIADTSLRFHWLIRRLTFDRFSLEERSSIFREIVPDAALGWLVDFTSSAWNQHHPREGRQSEAEETSLTTEEHAGELRQIALGRIRGAAADRSLIAQADLISILFEWRELAGNDPTEVLIWTKEILVDDEIVVRFAEAMTGESWSYSMGFDGLGDRVSKRTVKVRIDKDYDIIDQDAFRASLERIVREARLDKARLNIVSTFLEAWERDRSGKRRK